MKHYRIEGKVDGTDCGVYDGETAEDAVKAMLKDAGSKAEEPKMGHWIVTETTVYGPLDEYYGVWPDAWLTIEQLRAAYEYMGWEHDFREEPAGTFACIVDYLRDRAVVAVAVE